MAKGQMRSNKEKKKPKAEHNLKKKGTSAPSPFAAVFYWRRDRHLPHGITGRAIFANNFRQRDRFDLWPAAEMQQFIMSEDIAATDSRVGTERFVELKLIEIRDSPGPDGSFDDLRIDFRAGLFGHSGESAPIPFRDQGRLPDFVCITR